jgi:hypothetical protein
VRENVLTCTLFFSAALRVDTTTCQFIYGCSIGYNITVKKGATAIAEALKHNKALRELK